MRSASLLLFQLITISIRDSLSVNGNEELGIVYDDNGALLNDINTIQRNLYLGRDKTEQNESEWRTTKGKLTDNVKTNIWGV